MSIEFKKENNAWSAFTTDEALKNPGMYRPHNDDNTCRLVVGRNGFGPIIFRVNNGLGFGTQTDIRSYSGYKWVLSPNDSITITSDENGKV